MVCTYRFFILQLWNLANYCNYMITFLDTSQKAYSACESMTQSHQDQKELSLGLTCEDAMDVTKTKWEFAGQCIYLLSLLFSAAVAQNLSNHLQQMKSPVSCPIKLTMPVGCGIICVC